MALCAASLIFACAVRVAPQDWTRSSRTYSLAALKTRTSLQLAARPTARGHAERITRTRRHHGVLASMAVRLLAAVDRANQSSKVVPVGVSATCPSLGRPPAGGQCPATLRTRTATASRRRAGGSTHSRRCIGSERLVGIFQRVPTAERWQLVLLGLLPSGGFSRAIPQSLSTPSR